MVLIFKSRPLLNTMTTYGILWTASDITQELVVSKKDHVAWDKTARIATTGAFVIAPLIHNWIHVAEILFPGNAMKTVLKKVVSEQIMFSPFVISSFYLATSALEGKSGTAEVKAKFKKTYLAGLSYWPFVQVLNLRFVPHRFKPVTVAAASFVWTIFLCLMKEETQNIPRELKHSTPVQAYPSQQSSKD